MDEYMFRRSHVPAFGSWDCNDDDTAFTQCFESAGMLRYSYSEDRDLYVAGDLYDDEYDDVVTPAIIVVGGKAGYSKRGEKEGWLVCDSDYDMKAPPSPVSASPPPTTPPPYRLRPPPPKAVDEDLYKISPDFLPAHAKRKRGRSLLWRWLAPICVC